MPQRRMFSNRIANSAKFLQMPAESQLLYFHLILRADDDGIVETYPVMKLLGIASDNFKILIAKEFIKQLNQDQVVIITDWLEHNVIRADRKINSIYLPLLKEKYPEIEILKPEARSDVSDNSKRIGGQSTDGLGKVRLGKVKLRTTIAETSSASEFNYEQYLKTMDDDKCRHIQVIALYFKERKLKFDTLKEVQSAIKRHLRAAKEVSNFPDEKIINACDKAKENYPEYTIETIYKMLTK